MDNPMIDYKVLCEAKEEQMKQLKDIWINKAK